MQIYLLPPEDHVFQDLSVKITGLHQHLIKSILHISSNSGTSKYKIQNKAKNWQAQDQHRPCQFIRGIYLSIHNFQNNQNTDNIQNKRHISGISCKTQKYSQQPAKLHRHGKYYIKYPVKQKLGYFFKIIISLYFLLHTPVSNKTDMWSASDITIYKNQFFPEDNEPNLKILLI